MPNLFRYQIWEIVLKYGLSKFNTKKKVSAILKGRTEITYFLQVIVSRIHS